MRQRYSHNVFHHRALLIYFKRLRDLFLPKKEKEHKALFSELIDVDEPQTSAQRKVTEQNTRSQEREENFEEVISEEKSVAKKELGEEQNDTVRAPSVLKEKAAKRSHNKLFSIGKNKKRKDDAIMRTLKKAYQ